MRFLIYLLCFLPFSILAQNIRLVDEVQLQQHLFNHKTTEIFLKNIETSCQLHLKPYQLKLQAYLEKAPYLGDASSLNQKKFEENFRQTQNQLYEYSQATDSLYYNVKQEVYMLQKKYRHKFIVNFTKTDTHIIILPKSKTLYANPELDITADLLQSINFMPNFSYLFEIQLIKEKAELGILNIFKTPKE